MPIINTKRNHVSFGQPQPEDRYVATFIMPPNGGRALLTTQPIEQFDAALRWALSMADYMLLPIEVVTVVSEDAYLKDLCVAIGFEGLWRTDPADQRAGRELLAAMGVLT
jgi:hypothetical protein